MLGGAAIEADALLFFPGAAQTTSCTSMEGASLPAPAIPLVTCHCSWWCVIARGSFLDTVVGNVSVYRCATRCYCELPRTLASYLDRAKNQSLFALNINSTFSSQRSPSKHLLPRNQVAGCPRAFDRTSPGTRHRLSTPCPAAGSGPSFSTREKYGNIV